MRDPEVLDYVEGCIEEIAYVLGEGEDHIQCALESVCFHELAEWSEEHAPEAR